METTTSHLAEGGEENCVKPCFNAHDREQPGDFIEVGQEILRADREIESCSLSRLVEDAVPWISVRRYSRLALNGLLRLRCYVTLVGAADLVVGRLHPVANRMDRLCG